MPSVEDVDTIPMADAWDVELLSNAVRKPT
jgi:hypothetical protein